MTETIAKTTVQKAEPPSVKAAVPTPGPAAPLQDLARTQSAEDLDQLSRNLAEAMTRANSIFSNAFHDQSKEGFNADPFDVQGAVNQVWKDLATRPETLRDAHGALWRRYAEIWQSHAQALLTNTPLPEREAGRDKRFKDSEWRTNPAFSLMRETYLATAAWITELVEMTDGLDENTRRKAGFFIKQAVDAASPSNFLMTNPAALRALYETKGESLLKGLENLRHDLQRGHGKLAITQVDGSGFELGKNVATTPGKVVFRNKLIELIQYTPTTETVFDVPLLIFPPWINKFYIMDLQPKNSLIAWLVGQGHTVFVASWCNPNAEMAEWGFEQYMTEGVFAALDAVNQAIGAKQVNAVGYCIGGTLLGATLAYMARKKDKRIKSATFFAAQTDFKLAGDLLVFSDPPALKYLETRIQQKGGFLDAQAMADTFNALRSNDLVWNYVVENYYLGRTPPPFDLLFWNSDQTRMPRALHMFYLKHMYQQNDLAEGRLTLLGEPIDLKAVKVPIYMQSSKEDHIAPFGSVYRSAKAFGGPVRFLMAGSGHIAGVINPPAANKYQHWINEALPDTVEEWQADAVEQPGSWWPNWQGWLASRAGGQVPARDPSAGGLPVLEDAPGSYVRVKSDA